MFKFNLLPPEEKKEIAVHEITQWFAFFLRSLIILAIIFAVLCLNSYIYLYVIVQSQGSSITIEESSVKTQKLQEIEEKIKQANQKIDKAYQIQRGIVCWTPILEKISEIAPAGINLTNLSYQTAQNKVVLNGQAKTGEQFLNFKENLEKSQVFLEVESPLSNLINKENIDFNFNFKISTSTISCQKIK